MRIYLLVPVALNFRTFIVILQQHEVNVEVDRHVEPSVYSLPDLHTPGLVQRPASGRMPFAVVDISTHLSTSYRTHTFLLISSWRLSTSRSASTTWLLRESAS
jgi:hypothetical protein